MTARERIDEFLSQKRLAVVGVSREPGDFTRSLFRELCRRGYDTVPVNPNVKEVEGRTCYARVQDIAPPVDGALLMTSPPVTEQVVEDCAQAGIGRVWMHRGAGLGAVSRRAVAFCESRNICVIPGECPHMFFPETPFFHRVHGFVKKITGTYPR
jgi:predicted CoA-binding protein